MSNKDFKLKNGLVVSSLSAAGIVTTDSSGNISSTATVPVANGGTGQTTAGNALNALLPLQTSNENKYLQTNGTTTQWNEVLYQILHEAGSAKTARRIINFIGFALEDDAVNNKTNVTINGYTENLDGGPVDFTTQYDGGRPNTQTFALILNGGNI